MDDRPGVSLGELDPHDPPIVAQNLRSAANTVSHLTSENDRLENENSMLRQRIDLMKKNSDLKTATVLSSIITWMDEKKKAKDVTGINSRVGSPYRPSTPVFNESAYRFLQSQSDGGLDGQDEPPRYVPPAVRFDTSRNTSMAPPDAEPTTSAFREYTPHQSMQRSQSANQTFPKTSLSGSRGTAMLASELENNQPMRGSTISNCRCELNEPAFNESMLRTPNMTSTTKGTSSRGILNNDAGPYRPEDTTRAMSPDPEEVKRLAAKLARFSRPIDQVIGVRTEPTRYYQGIMELKPTRRLVGEIAFQLDRRILDYVFSGEDGMSANSKARKKRYYGYTVTHIFDKIRAECKDAYGIPNLKREMAMRYRLEFLMKRLAPLGYKLEIHAPFAQDMVNKFGLLSSPPERKTLDNFGLEDPRVLRMLVSKLMIFDDELKNTLILLDCLCLMAHEDVGPLFKW